MGAASSFADDVLGLDANNSGIMGDIAQAGQDVDDFVNDEIPGGWYTVGAVAAGGAALAYAPEIAAALGSEAAIAPAATEGAFDVAAMEGIGSTGIEAGATYGGAPSLSTTLGATSFPASEVAGTYQMGSGTALSADVATNPLNPFYGTATSSTNPLMTTAGYGGEGLGSAGSIVGSGAGLGVNTVGGTIAANAPSLAGLTAEQLGASQGITGKDVYNTYRVANALRNLAGSTQQQSRQLAGNGMPNLGGNVSGNPLAEGLRQYNMNQNPFTFAPKEQETTNPYDVSGEKGFALNTPNQSQLLANLLK